MISIKKSLIVCFLLNLGLLSPVLAQSSDQYYQDQWYLHKINVDEAWKITKGNDQIIVAVLDTGVDLNHPDLKGNIWINEDEIAGDGVDNDNNGYIDDVNGWNFYENISDPQPYLADGYSTQAIGHGTFISGIISAVHDNNYGIKGITENVKIMPLVVLDSYGYGYSYSVVEAINYAIDNGADVINLSFGGDDVSIDLKKAIVRANNNNVMVVAAAGNSAFGGTNLDEQNIYPVCYDAQWDENVILGVGSIDVNDELSYFSNYGKSCIDLVAPGEELVSLAYQDSKYSDLLNYFNSGYRGTSFSTAMVSGTVALMKSINPYLSNKQVVKIIQDTAIKLDSSTSNFEEKVSGGLVDTFQAVWLSQEMLHSASKLKIAVSADEKKNATIKLFDQNFVLGSQIEVFGESFEGLNINSADLDFDGDMDLVVGATKGNTPFVRGFDENQVLLSSFLAFDSNYQGGVNVSAGDVNGDGLIEYVVVPQSNLQPIVKIFDYEGSLIKEFLAFDKNLTQGLTITVGNVTGDNKDEIIVGSPVGVSAQFKVFDFQGKELKTVIAFVPQFKGGINLACANVDNQGYNEIIVGAGVGGGPHVRVLDFYGTQVASLFAYAPQFHGGVRVAAADLNQDGQAEIVTAAGPSGAPHVRVFNLNGILLNEIFAWEADYIGGVQVAIY